MTNITKVHSINEMYYTMCKDLLEHGSRVSNTTEIPNYIITLDNVNNCVINIRNNYKYLAAELLWYLNGRNDVKFISKYASLWAKLTDDGVTNNSAYGYILKYKHGFDQIEKMIELLTVDPNSRRAIININIPNEQVIETKDEMCTICLNFQIRNNKLNCTALLRSNDVYTGVVYDATYFILIQKYIANRLNIECGTYTHEAFSLHVYDRHLEKLQEVVNKYLNKDFELVDINYDILFDKYAEIIEEVENSDISPDEAFWKYKIYYKIS